MLRLSGRRHVEEEVHQSRLSASVGMSSILGQGIRCLLEGADKGDTGRRRSVLGNGLKSGLGRGMGGRDPVVVGKRKQLVDDILNGSSEKIDEARRERVVSSRPFGRKRVGSGSGGSGRDGHGTRGVEVLHLGVGAHAECCLLKLYWEQGLRFDVQRQEKEGSHADLYSEGGYPHAVSVFQVVATRLRARVDFHGALVWQRVKYGQSISEE